jgi:flagellar M-ring protein FliF
VNRNGLRGLAQRALLLLAAFVAVPMTTAHALPATTQMQATQAYDDALAGQLQALLDRVAGPGHSTVHVAAQLDFRAVATVRQGYVHNPAVPPIAARSSRSSYRGTFGSGRSVSASVANSLGVVTRSSRAAPGRITHLSVAVLVDRSRHLNLRAVRALITTAAGVRASRGDVLSVQAVAFTRPPTTRLPTTAPPSPRTWNVVTIPGAAVIGVLLVVLVLTLRRRMRAE